MSRHDFDLQKGEIYVIMDYVQHWGGLHRRQIISYDTACQHYKFCRRARIIEGRNGEPPQSPDPDPSTTIPGDPSSVARGCGNGLSLLVQQNQASWWYLLLVYIASSLPHPCLALLFALDGLGNAPRTFVTRWHHWIPRLWTPSAGSHSDVPLLDTGKAGKKIRFGSARVPGWRSSAFAVLFGQRLLMTVISMHFVRPAGLTGTSSDRFDRLTRYRPAGLPHFRTIRSSVVFGLTRICLESARLVPSPLPSVALGFAIPPGHLRTSGPPVTSGHRSSRSKSLPLARYITVIHLRRRQSLKDAGGKALEDYLHQAHAASVKNRAKVKYKQCARKAANLAAHDAMMNEFVAVFDTAHPEFMAKYDTTH
ncbi:hypothetical protein C8J57DRAFT_1251297 [Mycena rebaudengoi]|nr:hypothetical protein C8J57DRAFT_1251297 [Mycena rebaudengoi]